MARKTRQTVDIVIPVYDEAGVVEQTYASLCKVINRLPFIFTIYYVNDGSTDSTSATLASLAAHDDRVNALELSRNFGHQAALTAGMDAARGDVVITMDCDGQHPPELIPRMLELINQGYDIVQGQRVDSMEAGALKKLSSGGFYRLINAVSGTHILPGAADFRALTRQTVNALKSMPEYHRFLRGMISWIGYSSVILTYHEPKRIAGKSKYSPAKMLRLAMDAIFSFSLAPLYIGLSLGGLLLFLALLEMIYVLSFWLTGRTSNLAPGWSSLMFVILIIGGVLMVLLGFIGVYVGYIFQEAKRRPVYLIKNGEKRMTETKSYDFVFLRHGESVGNAEQRLQGQAEYPLTDVGRAQAKALGERWIREKIKFDSVITSPLARAMETAEIISGCLHIPIAVDPIWMERNAGEIAGLTRKEALERFPEPEFRTPYDAFGQNGEGDWELFLRAGTAVHQLLKRPPGKYLIVSHGGLLNKAMYALLGIPVQPNFNGPSFRFENTGFAAFRYLPSRHQWRMLRLESPG